MPWLIEHIGKTHDRTAFDCGKPSLNDFLTKRVNQYEKRGIGRTYVVVEEGQRRVVAYYTIANGELRLEDLPDEIAKKLPRHPMPVVLLARLAVDATVRGQGLGALLLKDALSRSLDLAERVGVFAVFVEAIDEEAVRFYEHFGFAKLKNRTDKLYLRLESVRSA